VSLQDIFYVCVNCVVNIIDLEYKNLEHFIIYLIITIIYNITSIIVLPTS